MDSAAARRPAAPGCRPARWSAPRCAPAARPAVPAPDIKELTGGFPTPPIPPAALVTGGARRIGRALVLALAEAGFAVAVHYHHSRDAADSVVAEITRRGG